jgi:hypothetical protein
MVNGQAELIDSLELRPRPHLAEIPETLPSCLLSTFSFLILIAEFGFNV